MSGLRRTLTVLLLLPWSAPAQPLAPWCAVVERMPMTPNVVWGNRAPGADDPACATDGDDVDALVSCHDEAVDWWFGDDVGRLESVAPGCEVRDPVSAGEPDATGGVATNAVGTSPATTGTPRS